MTDEAKSLQPRLVIQEAYSPTDQMIAKYEEIFKYYNPLTLYIDAPTVTIKGTVTELGAPVLNRRVMVRLTSPDGRYTERTFTDLEGNFVFYEIPQNLSLMAIAVDTTYKYNAVILSKIQTILDGE